MRKTTDTIKSQNNLDCRNFLTVSNIFSLSQDLICQQIDKIQFISDRKKLEEENPTAVGY